MKKLHVFLLSLFLMLLACVSLSACGGNQAGTNEGGTPTTTQVAFSFEEVEGGYAIVGIGNTAAVKESLVLPQEYQGKPVVAVRAKIDAVGATEDTTIEIHIPASIKHLNLNLISLDNPTVIRYEGSIADFCSLSFDSYYVLESVKTHDNMPAVTQAVEKFNGLFYDAVAFYANGSLIFDENGFTQSAFSGVESIPSYAFAGVSCGDLVLPSCVKTVEDYAFFNASATSITIQNGVEKIGVSSMPLCRSIEKIHIEGQSLIIGKNAFEVCDDWWTKDGADEIVLIDRYLIKVKNSYASIKLGIIGIAGGAYEKGYGEIEIPYTVRVIADDAFQSTHSLNYTGTHAEWMSLTFDTGNFGMGSMRFSGAVIPSGEIVIPTSVTKIPPYAYASDAVTGVVLHDGIEVIGDHAFDTLYLPYIDLPKSLTYFGENAFRLKTVNVDSVEHFLSISTKGKGILGCIDTATWKEADSGLFINHARLSQTITLPQMESYPFGLFTYSEPVTVVFDDSVLFIREEAFLNCTAIQKILLGKNTLSIEKSAFEGCTALEEIVFGENLAILESSAFKDCSSLKGVAVPRLKEVGTYIFSGCTSLQKVTFEACNGIPTGTFQNCYELKSVTYSDGTPIWDNLVSIEDYAFQNCVCLPVFFSEGNTRLWHIGESAFEACWEIQTLFLPDTLTKIGNNAFSSCESLSELVIGDSIKEIPASAFSYCVSLYRVTVGQSITSTEDWFRGCGKLSEIYDRSATGCASQLAVFHYYTSFYGESGVVRQNDFVFVTDGRGNYVLVAYEGEQTELTLPASINGCSYSITPYCFYFYAIEKVTIPTGIKAIGEHAFSHCSNLTSVVFSEGLERIGMCAFYGTALTSVTIPSTVTVIEEHAFSYAESLKTVTFAPNSALHTIGNGAFSFTAIEDIVLPSKATDLGIGIFGGCYAIQSIRLQALSEFSSVDNRANIPVWLVCTNEYDPAKTVEANQYYIDTEGVARGLILHTPSSFRHLAIQSGVIANHATMALLQLKSLVIGVGVTEIGDYAFTSCSEDLAIFYAGTASMWNTIYKGASANVYFYSETNLGSGYWHYAADGVTPVLW